MPAYKSGVTLALMDAPAQDGQALVADSTKEFGIGWQAVAKPADLLGLGGAAPVYAALGATLALALGTNEVVKSTPTATGTYTTTVPAAGRTCVVIILQSNTTAKTMTFGTGFKPTGTLALGNTASRVFVVAFVSDGTSLYEVSRTIAMVA